MCSLSRREETWNESTMTKMNAFGTKRAATQSVTGFCIKTTNGVYIIYYITIYQTRFLANIRYLHLHDFSDISLTIVDGSVRDVSDGGSFDDVTDHELLDRLVLRGASGCKSKEGPHTQ